MQRSFATKASKITKRLIKPANAKPAHRSRGPSKYKNKQLPFEDDGKTYRLVCAPILERLPVILPDLEKWEQDYLEMKRKIELKTAQRLPKDFWFTEPGTVEVEPEDAPFFAEWDEDELVGDGFQIAKRETEDDAANNRHSLNRALKQRVFLIVQDPTTMKWFFPTTEKKDAETMKDAAFRELQSVVGSSLEAYTVGNAPMGYLKVMHDNDAQYDGTKVFFYKSQLSEGDVQLNASKANDYLWVTQNELAEYLEADVAEFDAYLPFIFFIFQFAMSTTNVDLILLGRHIVPVVPHGVVYENHAIVIANGLIVDILPASHVSKYSAKETIELHDHILMPGMVNAHTHASMTLLRGLADDKPLCNWLMEDIFPTEGKFVSDEFVCDGTLHSAAEMIRSGTTCANEMYFFPDAAASTFESVGMRALVGQITMEFPTAYGSGPDDYFAKARVLFNKYKDSKLIKLSIAPHAPYTVADGTFAKVKQFSEEFNARIHLHLHETEGECCDSETKTPSMLCHQSSEKCRPLKKGVNVAIGTDGAASNNTLNMFAEMKLAAILAKAESKESTSVPAATALRMATLNGAKAVGMDQYIGSLEIGKHADIVAVAADSIEMLPMYNAISHLVYVAGREHVSDVWVYGKRLLKDHKLTTIDENVVKSHCKKWYGAIAAHHAEMQAKN
ncbi:5-methylthioadenosine/S-adenosylhomocysteine deaminase [Thraustotheca clavata]|uniref:5-methylthioadenosine/S-adenosylhomocysteine deaminase n=1 Tax=Thraustotheca clavata TaxID=74557 RepID=A0A1V9ZZH3_9STRA|nr:5-methylthioadenosine/S-adenosylhomocysteine deaminase [Thraustotheca clavata]